MDLDYDKVFKVYIRVLRLSCLCPNTKRNVTWWIHFCLQYGTSILFVFLLMQNIIFLNLKDNDFSTTCKNGALVVVYLETLLQIIIFVWREEHLSWLMNKMKEDYELVKQRPQKEQDIIKGYASKSVNVCRTWMLIPCSVLFSFPIINVTLMTYYYIIGEFRLLHLYEIVFPDFIEIRKNNFVIYLLIYSLQMTFGASSAIMMITFAPLGPNFMLHVCGILDVLKSRIEVLFKCYNKENVKQELKEVVKQLQYVYEFVFRINACFKIAYEITFKATTILVPITCYEVLEASKRKELSMEFFTLIVGGITMNSTLCFYSDLLLQKGEELRDAVYLCGWEKVYDRETHSTIRVILVRAYQPVAMRTLFRNVCLDTLTDLFNQSYTLFNLMNAAWS